MFCKNCGNKIDDDSTFCDKCGYKIKPETELDKKHDTENDTDDKALKKITTSTPESESFDKTPKKNNWMKVAALLLVVAAAAVVVFFAVKRNGKKSEKDESVGGSFSISEDGAEQVAVGRNGEPITTAEAITKTEVTTEAVTESATAKPEATTAKPEATIEPTTENIQATPEPTTETVTTEEPEVTYAHEETEDMNSINAISNLIGLQAKCETSDDFCRCGLDYSENPYDVDYDYGDLYQSYVDACDWSLVFDADYYAEQFPYLALQYNYDKDWLLYHFQTIGIHEGRQGCADFNVRVYLDSTCYDNGHIYETFDKNWECYYFYYMLNYDSQKSLETVAKDGINAKTQYKTVLTYNQAKELDQLNALRAENNLPALQINSELNAFANYRARIDFEEHNKAHVWAENHRNNCLEMAKTVADNYNLNVITTIYAENKTMREVGKLTTGYDDLIKSEEHKAQMLYDNISYTGISNNFNGFNDFDERTSQIYNTNVTVNFEIFI